MNPKEKDNEIIELTGGNPPATVRPPVNTYCIRIHCAVYTKSMRPVWMSAMI